MVDVYPLEVRPGPANMAADDVLLERAAQGLPAVRLYAWREPTLSLGYFQPAAARAILPQVPWLRRASGGAAILHGDGDLTYALAIPPGTPIPHGESSWVCVVHRAVQRLFAARGISAKLVVCGEARTLGPTLCFLDQTPGDLVVDGVKVAGSAQRKYRGATLQHGTIRLATSRLLPALPGACELAGQAYSAPSLAADMEEALPHLLGGPPRRAAWSAEDEAAMASSKYAADEWNAKR